MKIGYARVSTIEQNLEMQIEALKDFGCDKIFSEKISGISKNLPEKEKAISFLEEGDILVVFKFDRLSRSTFQLLGDIETIKNKGANIVSIQDKIDTTSASGKLHLHLFAVLSEFERNLISERTKLGLESVRKRGTILGRPRGREKETIAKCKLVDKLSQEGISVEKACKEIGVSRSSFYAYKRDIL